MRANRNCRSFAAAASPFSLNQPRGKLKKKLMIKKLLLHSGTPPYGFLGNTVIFIHITPHLIFLEVSFIIGF